MFANLKKKIESEVGDLSRLAPSNVLNRTNSSTLSSRQPSVSSLTSEPTNLSGLQAPLSPNPVEFSNVTPSRGGSVGGSLIGIKVKQLEEKLQAQESDFAWRLSTKDDEITNLNKTIEILTGQLRNQDSEVKKKLVRVQEDIDDLEGFSQQENAKLKHLLLNKEEELGGLRNLSFLKDQEISALTGRVKELEVENGRVKVALEKLGHGEGIEGVGLEVGRLERELEKIRNENEALVKEISGVREGVEGVKSERDAAVLEVETLKGRLGEVERLGVENGALRVEVDEVRKELEHVCGVKDGVEKEVLGLRGRVVELEAVFNENEGLKCQVQRLRGVEEERDRLVGEVEGLRGGAKDVEGEKDKVAMELDNVVKENLRLRDEVNEVKGVLKGVEVEKEGWGREVEELRRRVNELEDGGEVRVAGEVKLLQDMVSDKERVVKELEGRLEGEERVVKEMEAQIGVLSGKVREVEENWRIEVECLKGERDRVAMELKLVKTQLCDCEGVVEGLRGEVRELEGERDRVLGEIEGVKVQNLRLVEELEGVRGEVDRVKNENEALKGEVLELRGGVEDKVRVIGELEAKVKQSFVEAEVVKRLEEEVCAKGRMVEEREEMRRCLEREIEALKLEVEALKRGGDRVLELQAEVTRLNEEKKLVECERDRVKGEVEGVREKWREAEGEKDELIVNVSEVQARVDELEEEVKMNEDVKRRVEELECAVAEKEKQLRQQSHALTDLRRSLAKELKASGGSDKESAENPSNHMNGGVKLDSVSLCSDNSAATLPQYETDVNFMYLRSVLFKYLTSQDPQITSHLTRVVATLLHLTEEETNTLIQSSESRSNQHLLSHIIK